MSTEMPTVDYKDLATQAAAMVIAESTPQSVPPVVEPVAAPVVPSQTGQTPTPTAPAIAPVTPATPGSITSQAEQKIFELQLGNKVEKLTEAQIKDAYFNGLRQEDYTKKTQDVARQRAELAEAVEQFKRQQQAAIPQQVAQPVPSQVAPSVPSFDPEAPMTMGQAMQLAQAVQQRMAQIESGSPQQLEKITNQIVHDRLEVMKFTEAINSEIGSILTDQPILKTIPEIEHVIRFRVAQREPQTLDETRAAFRLVASEIAGQFDQQIQTRTQHNTIQRQQLTAGGIEPPGGTVPMPSAPSYRTNDNKLDWTKLAAAAVELSNNGG